MEETNVGDRIMCMKLKANGSCLAQKSKSNLAFHKRYNSCRQTP